MTTPAEPKGMTVEVVIKGTYTIPPDALRYYGNPATADAAAAVDQGQYDEGHVAPEDILGWLDNESFEITMRGKT